MKFTQFLKWVGIVDGAIMAAAIAVARSYPPAQPYVDTVLEVGGTVATVVGGYAHVTAGSQTVNKVPS